MANKQLQLLPLNQVDDTGFTLHATRGWLQTVADVYQLQASYLVALHNNQHVAVMPVLAGKSKRFVPPSVHYYNPIQFNLPQKKHANQNLLNRLAVKRDFAAWLKKNFRRVHFNFNPTLQDARAFNWQEFRVKPMYTFVLDFANWQDEDFFSSTRTKLRKAQKLDYTFNYNFALQEFIELNRQTYQRRGYASPFAEEKLLQFLNGLQAKNSLRQFNLVQNKEIISVQLLADDGQDIYGLFATTKPEQMDTGANTMLVHHILQHYHGKRRFFDMCGANIEPIARFKAGFGGKLLPFYQVDYGRLNPLAMLHKLI